MAGEPDESGDGQDEAEHEEGVVEAGGGGSCGGVEGASGEIAPGRHLAPREGASKAGPQKIATPAE